MYLTYNDPVEKVLSCFNIISTMQIMTKIW